MIRLEIVCDKCKDSRELGLDNYIFNPETAISESGYQVIKDSQLCVGCATLYTNLLEEQQKQLEEFLSESTL